MNLLFAGFYFMAHSLETINSLITKSLLTAIGFEKGYIGKKRKIICKCKCGNIKHISTDKLISGKVISCGCISNYSKHGLSITGKGRKRHPLYNIWSGMKSRCKDLNDERYGGRGITYCKEWEKFIPFYDWAIDKWAKGLEIDRKNNDENYTPDNCQFVTDKINGRNKSNTIKIGIGENKKTILEWSEELNIKEATLWARYYKKWGIEQILSTTMFKSGAANKIK